MLSSEIKGYLHVIDIHETDSMSITYFWEIKLAEYDSIYYGYAYSCTRGLEAKWSNLGTSNEKVALDRMKKKCNESLI